MAVDDGWKALHNPINSQQMSKDETHIEEKNNTYLYEFGVLFN